MIKRLTAATSFGTVITFGLLFMMQLLIATGEGAVTNETRFAMVDFVRVERNEIIETKKEKPEKPPEPEQQPELPSPEQLDNFDNAMTVSVSTPQINNTMRLGGVGFGITDGEYLPIVKVALFVPS